MIIWKGLHNHCYMKVFIAVCSIYMQVRVLYCLLINLLCKKRRVTIKKMIVNKKSMCNLI